MSPQGKYNAQTKSSHRAGKYLAVTEHGVVRSTLLGLAVYYSVAVHHYGFIIEGFGTSPSLLSTSFSMLSTREHSRLF